MFIYFALGFTDKTCIHFSPLSSLKILPLSSEEGSNY